MTAPSRVRWVKHRDYPFLWVDVALVDAAWKLDARFYLSPGSGWRWDQRLAGQELVEISMPLIECDANGNEFGFVDGRHRFAWVRDNGALRVPVCIADADLTDIVRARFGGRRAP